jgi:iron complex transport system ATP-binding protein
VTLAVEQISHAYRRVGALTEISAQATAGRITAVIGPNAAGKSTLLRCIIGGLRPTQGCVLIDGEPAHRLKTMQLARRVAYVPQRSVVSASFTVREVVELGRYALPPSRRRVDEALAQLDLVEIADRPYPALSVGQQQRAALARAVAQLAGDGHLILDEPTSAMDLRHVREAMLLLRRLADGGATVLVAVHDLMLAASAADECWLLDRGRLAASGPARDVMNLERLHEVFGVGFEWVSRPGRSDILLAETDR